MRCPNCKEEIEDGFLYCKKCGAEIRIVPDYNPLVEDVLSGSLKDIFKEDASDPAKNGNSAEKEREDKGRDEKKPSKTEAAKPPKGRLSRKKLFAVIILVLFVVGILAGSIVIHVQNNSWEYQYERAAAMTQKQNYDRAMEYLDRAMELMPDQLDMWLLRAEIAEAQKDSEMAAESFDYILTNIDPVNQEVYTRLINLYIEEGNLGRVKETLASCPLTAVQRYFADYIAAVPTASFPDGIYYDTMSIELEADGNDIYFTTDGTAPTRESTQYEGPITLTEGTTTIRAISVTETGIQSDEAIFNYEISYLEPELPEISPASGEYVGELEIVVQVPDGCTVLYTLDGSLPNLDSNVYTGPIRIQTSAVFTAVSVSLSDRLSDSIVRSYTILPAE